MGKTINRGYPYPSDYNLDADVPKDIKSLAEAIDLDIKDIMNEDYDSQSGQEITIESSSQREFKEFIIGGNSKIETNENSIEIDLTQFNETTDMEITKTSKSKITVSSEGILRLYTKHY